MYTAPVDYLFISLSAVQSFSTGGEGNHCEKGAKESSLNSQDSKYMLVAFDTPDARHLELSYAFKKT